jgi:hypothetical protein
MQLHSRADTSAVSAAHRDELELQSRIRAEFNEMPGLTLTLRQAARLFSLEPVLCGRVLGALVAAGLLATDGKTFANSTDHRRSA